MQYAFVTAGEIDLLVRILAEEERYGRKVLRIEYPNKGRDCIQQSILFTDHIVLMTPMTEAEAMPLWDQILGKKPIPKPGKPSTAPCTNGTCQKPQAADCSNLFCPACCEEKCLGDCARAVKDALGENEPNF